MASLVDSLVDAHSEGCGCREGTTVVVYEEGRFTCVTVPSEHRSAICFDEHLNDLPNGSHGHSETGASCCTSETTHVHAHVHRGEFLEDIVLEQCTPCKDSGLCLPGKWEEPEDCVQKPLLRGEHAHEEGCGHNKVVHRDHFGWLLPIEDGSFSIQCPHEGSDGDTHFHEHGRLVRLGASTGVLRRRRPQHLDVFNLQTASHAHGHGHGHCHDYDHGHGDSHTPVPVHKENEGLMLEPIRSPLRVSEVLPLGRSVEARDEHVRLTIGGRMERTVLDVMGICCPSEVPLIKRILVPLPGVEEVAVDVINKTVTVMHDPTLISDVQLVKSLNEANLEASLHQRGSMRAAQRFPNWWSLLSGALLAISLVHYAFDPLKYVALGAILVAGPPIALKALVAIRRGFIDINMLMTLAVIGAIAIGDYTEAAAVVFLFSIADWLESHSTERARAAMAAVMSLSPETATVAATGLRVKVEEIEIGTVVTVKPGELVPIDGVVDSGVSAVDESSITGESLPVKKEPGGEVWGGTLNTTGFLAVRTTARAADSAVARMVKLVEEAQSQRSKSEQIVETFAKYYTPLVIVVVVLLIVIPYSLALDNAEDFLYQALVLLVVACPCALVISTPVTTACGIAQGARNGVLVKGGLHLETLGRLRSLAFDKTGTLTEGTFRVAQVLPLDDGANMRKILYWICCAESQSSHPMAAALVKYGRIKGVEPTGQVAGYETLEGEGIAALVDGHQVHIGNTRLARRLGWESAADLAILEQWASEGGTVGWVGVDHSPVALFSVADQPRKEAREAVAQIERLGLKVAMLTGDNGGAARAVQQQIGGDLEVFSELLPQDKVTAIAALKARYRVVGMVGDGINDAPALAAANVGIAMGVAGTAVAMETADVALMTNDLRQLAAAVRLGRDCRWKVIQNVALSIVTKAIVIGFAAAGYAALWAAIVADVGTSLAVVFNSMRVLKRDKKLAKACITTVVELPKDTPTAEKECCSKEGDCQVKTAAEGGCCSGKGADKDSSSSSATNADQCCSKELVGNGYYLAKASAGELSTCGSKGAEALAAGSTFRAEGCCSSETRTRQRPAHEVQPSVQNVCSDECCGLDVTAWDAQNVEKDGRTTQCHKGCCGPDVVLEEEACITKGSCGACGPEPTPHSIVLNMDNIGLGVEDMRPASSGPVEKTESLNLEEVD